MKKLFVLIAALLLVLTACSGSKETSNSNGKGSDEKATLTYAIWDKNQEPAMTDIADKFMKAHPNIKIKVEVTPWDQYWTKLETAATGKSLPDLFWLNSANIQKYARGGVIEPISEQIDSDGIDLSKYPQALVDIYTVDGKHFALPKDYDTIGLWYNKELFDKAGLEYPNENWTWDDLRSAAKKLTDSSKGVYGFAAALAGQTGFYNTIAQAGGYIIKDGKAGHNTPEGIRGLKLWTDMINDKVSPTQAQMTDTPPNALFESGKVAMMFAGSWMQIEFAKNEYTKDKVDVTFLPKDKQRATVIHGLGNVIATNTKYPKAAWEFAKYLGSEEAAKIQADTGTVIPAYEGTQQAWVDSNHSFNLQVFIDSAKDSIPNPASMETQAWQKIETDILTKAWSGEISIEDAAKQVSEGVEGVLAKEKK